jgi:thioredoxin reductase-like selenoprotein T
MMLGEEYPAPPFNQYLAQLTTVAQFAMMALLMFGQTIFQKLEMQTPQIITQLQENKFVVIMMSFFLCNMIKNQLLATGAFEIYFDDELVFSKLQTDQVPDMDMLNRLLQTYNVL